MIDISRVLEENLTREHQLPAATDTASEVLTLACAGSGKSRTLAFRIARLIAEGEDPSGIVAFTFTEKAGDAIKQWVARALEAARLEPTILRYLANQVLDSLTAVFLHIMQRVTTISCWRQ